MTTLLSSPTSRPPRPDRRALLLALGLLLLLTLSMLGAPQSAHAVHAAPAEIGRAHV